jgi:hypothetical protein
MHIRIIKKLKLKKKGAGGVAQIVEHHLASVKHQY